MEGRRGRERRGSGERNGKEMIREEDRGEEAARGERERKERDNPPTLQTEIIMKYPIPICTNHQSRSISKSSFLPV